MRELYKSKKVGTMKKLYLILNSLVLVSIIYFSCGNREKTSVQAKVENNSENENILSEVTIGHQIWTSKNLNVNKFRNGEHITQAKTPEEWVNAGLSKQPAWCYHNNDPKNGTLYGKLYNWYAVNDPRVLAPKGYHIPDSAEWTILFNFLGGTEIAGKKMKSKSGWYQNGNGTNEFEFSGLPSSVRGSDIGLFGTIGLNAYWWSSKEENAKQAWALGLNCYYDDVSFFGFGDKSYGFSVRCLKD